MNNKHKLSRKTKWIVFLLIILIIGLVYWGTTKIGKDISNEQLEETDKTVLSWFNEIAQPHGFRFSKIVYKRKGDTDYFYAISNDDIRQISEKQIFDFFMDFHIPDGYEEYQKSDIYRDRYTRIIKLASGKELKTRYPYEGLCTLKIKIGEKIDEKEYGFSLNTIVYGDIDAVLTNLKTAGTVMKERIYEKKYVSLPPSSYNSSISGGSSSTDNYSHDKFDAMTIARKIVKNNLKSPSTAKFCDTTDASISCSGNTWTVRGWVEAQNSFGAVIRNNFTVKITFTSKDVYTIDSCSIA